MTKRILTLLFGLLTLVPVVQAEEGTYERYKPLIWGGIAVTGLIAATLYYNKVTPSKIWKYTKKKTTKAFNWLGDLLFGDEKENQNSDDKQDSHNKKKFKVASLKCVHPSCKEGDLSKDSAVIVGCSHKDGLYPHCMHPNCAKEYFSDLDSCPKCKEILDSEFLNAMELDCPYCTEAYDDGDHKKTIIPCKSTYCIITDEKSGERYVMQRKEYKGKLHICCKECYQASTKGNKSCPDCRAEIYPIEL